MPGNKAAGKTPKTIQPEKSDRQRKKADRLEYETAEKVLELAFLLGGSSGLTQDQMAEEFKVVKRTIQRRLKAVERCFPVHFEEWEEDNTKFYKLRDPKLAPFAKRDLAAFTEEDLAVFNTAALLLRQNDLNAQAETLARAGARLKVLLNLEKPRYADNLEDLLRYEGLARRPGPSRRYNEAAVKDLREAMRSFHQVKIIYAGRESPARDFTLIPLGFLYGERQHYLVASHADGYDSGRPHHFILSRIQKVERLDIIFEENPGFSLEDHAANSFGVYQEKPFQVEWRFSPKAAAEAENYLFHPKQQMKRSADGSLTVRFKAGGRLEMAWHLCTWGREVTVIKPEGFWESVREHLPQF